MSDHDTGTHTASAKGARPTVTVSDSMPTMTAALTSPDNCFAMRYPTAKDMAVKTMARCPELTSRTPGRRMMSAPRSATTTAAMRRKGPP